MSRFHWVVFGGSWYCEGLTGWPGMAKLRNARANSKTSRVIFYMRNRIIMTELGSHGLGDCFHWPDHGFAAFDKRQQRLIINLWKARKGCVQDWYVISLRRLEHNAKTQTSQKYCLGKNRPKMHIYMPIAHYTFSLL